MIHYKKTAIIVGVLYIIGTVAGVLSYVLTGPDSWMIRIILLSVCK